ncbi:MAG: integral membrane protein [Candidatus Paceibacteria bacterium]|jgi:integral membrane protein
MTILQFDTPTARLRAVAFLEGLSYLALLLIAMPMKYLADLPLAVRITGSVHGVLFVALGLLVLQGVFARGKGFLWAVRVGIASLIPFGTFFLDRGLAADDADFRG